MRPEAYMLQGYVREVNSFRKKLKWDRIATQHVELYKKSVVIFRKEGSS
jgi:hypothetical protein